MSINKKIHFLFGEMGSGKNYYGKIIADLRGIPFFDGDDFLPEKLRKKVAVHKSLTNSEVNIFVTRHLIPAIQKLDEQHPGGFVISQALYRDKHRIMISKMFDAQLYWVRPTHIRHIRNLLTRMHPLRWIALAALSKPWFEKPTVDYELIV